MLEFILYQKMSTLQGDIFDSYVNTTEELFSSDNVQNVLDSYDSLVLTSRDGRTEEPELRDALEREKSGLLKAQLEAENIISDIKKLESEYLNLLKEKEGIEAKIEEMRSETIPCKEDEDILNKLREKLRLYKDITGIRWDYSAPENLAKGYICSHLKNHIHTFEIPLDDPEVTEKLWQEIENSSLKPSTDFKKDKNSQGN